ncbi:site-specific DNA-methyltransferase, partial [Salmonella enterica subsp. enterica serovar Muenchen]|nr:site-specific DNA-methyltransferase [Salmonella enterica subsp. enterica serovar Thompson]EAR2417508.1 site-specific DNA-methyltransferase [Salmonella enterica]EDM8561122.1 site-specific DNA-methyltransferase [Salmonella enterica subsp. enterica serovar Muenchen]EBD3978557.1 site-specific DNA-methyltransferase [Salmonella enterica]EBD9975819.1 site-specific DNA-methyltransferase [Salmonella enterica]
MKSKMQLKINELEMALGLTPTLNIHIDEILSHPLELNSSFDSSLYIGDNLAYLRSFAETTPNIIDLCYIDPPYNTGNKFIYHDNRKAITSSIFGKHGEWMSFMLPRLACAHELLKKTGIIAISIDDYEYAYLKILMDQIFGEDNFIGCIVVCRSKNGKGSNRNIATSHEYLLIYGKSSKACLVGLPDDDTLYNKTDEYGHYKIDGLFRKKGEASLRSDRPNMFYPLYANPKTGHVSTEAKSELVEIYPIDSKGIERRWLWGRDTAKERSWQLYASNKGVIYVKNYSNVKKRKKVRTLWNETSFYTERATNEIKEIFGDKVFDTPKPLSYISAILDSLADSDALILDFFAGSATTAHAAALLNKSDGGKRKTILMENNTLIPEKHLAYKLGFKTIADISLF